MKYKYYILQYIFLAFIIIVILTTIFGPFTYYYYAQNHTSQTPFKETLSVWLNFVGSFGTVASILVTFYLYVEQRKKDIEYERKQQEKDLADKIDMIFNSKPKMLIRFENIRHSYDSNGQAALAFDLIVENYRIDAASFSLSFEYADETNNDLIIQFVDHEASFEIFKAGTLRNITVFITSPNDIRNPPQQDKINICIVAHYIGEFNNIFYDYFLLKDLNNFPPPINRIKSKVLTPRGESYTLN